ncbi:MAG: hypothetical protein P9M14_00460 [Candidatus Alcyoniella australis]|nr:hypothetical protein [Candidatus Alcyoniella australis]
MFRFVLAPAIAFETSSLPIIALLLEIDVLRALFYALLPATILLLLIPRIRGPLATTAGPALGLALVCAITVAGLPYLTLTYRYEYVFRVPGMKWCFVLLGLNVFGVTLLQTAGQWVEPLRRAVLRLFPLIDLALPALVWSAYRWEAGRIANIYRPLPILFLTTLMFSPLIITPVPMERSMSVDGLLQQVAPTIGMGYYQVRVNERSGNVILANEPGKFILIDPVQRRIINSLELDPGFQVQGLALSADRRQAAFVNPLFGHSLLLDADTLQVLQHRRLVDPPPRDEEYFDCWRTEWDSEHGLLYAYRWGDIALISPEMDRITAWRSGLIPFALPDAQHGEIHVLESEDDVDYRLVCLDARTLEVRRSIEVPAWPEQIVLDPATDRLIVSFPLLGRLLVVDRSDYRFLRWADSVPGVRRMAIYDKQRWIITCGFSPIIEIRQLDDFRLVRRLTARGWARWGEVDQQRDKFYFTTQGQGAWQLDLARADSDERTRVLQRLDPFYLLLNSANAVFRSLLGMNRGI